VSRGYGRFAAVAAEAAAGLRGLDAGAWVGSEGDLFRAQVAEIPPHLDTAHRAFGQAVPVADDEQREVLDGRIDRLQASWEELATAGGIHARVLEAARQAAGAIRTAARTSPTAGQNWLEDR
jgi:hypothetical protein